MPLTARTKEMAQTKIIALCDNLTAAMAETLNSDGGWVGDWYKRYIYSTDKPVLGSKARREDKVFFIPSLSWA